MTTTIESHCPDGEGHPGAEQALVAEEEAKKVVQEVKYRATPSVDRAQGRVGKGKEAPTVDLIQHLAKELPEMRRLDRALFASSWGCSPWDRGEHP